MNILMTDRPTGLPKESATAVPGTLGDPVTADRNRSRVRLLAWPFIPVVAAWDGIRAFGRWWMRFGAQLLRGLDPIFDRFSSLYFRLSDRIRPAVERIARKLARLAVACAPVAQATAHAVLIAFRWVARVAAACYRVVRPAGRALSATARLACRQFVIAGRWLWRATQPARQFIARTRHKLSELARLIVQELRTK